MNGPGFEKRTPDGRSGGPEGDLPEVSPEVVPPPDLLGAILERTTGAVCPRLEERLVAWVDSDDGIEPAASELLREHLEHCSGCARLAAELRALRADLPALAEIEPDLRFALDVFERTSRAPRPESALGRLRNAAITRARAWWDQTIRRPRIALELAYVAAFLFVLIAGSPSRWNLPGFPPGRAGRAVAAAAVDFGENGRPVERLMESFDFIRRIGGPGQPGQPTLLSRAGSAVGQGKRTAGRLADTANLVQACAGAMGRGFLHGDMVGAWGAWQDFRVRLDRVWRGGPDGTSNSGTEPSPPPVRSVGQPVNEPKP